MYTECIEFIYTGQKFSVWIFQYYTVDHKFTFLCVFLMSFFKKWLLFTDLIKSSTVHSSPVELIIEIRKTLAGMWGDLIPSGPCSFNHQRLLNQFSSFTCARLFLFAQEATTA